MDIGYGMDERTWPRTMDGLLSFVTARGGGACAVRIGSRDGAKLSAELVGQAGGRADCLCCPGRLDFGAVSAVTFKSDVAATFGLFSRCMRTRKRRGVSSAGEFSGGKISPFLETTRFYSITGLNSYSLRMYLSTSRKKFSGIREAISSVKTHSLNGSRTDKAVACLSVGRTDGSASTDCGSQFVTSLQVTIQHVEKGPQEFAVDESRGGGQNTNLGIKSAPDNLTQTLPFYMIRRKRCTILWPKQALESNSFAAH